MSTNVGHSSNFYNEHFAEDSARTIVRKMMEDQEIFHPGFKEEYFSFLYDELGEETLLTRHLARCNRSSSEEADKLFNDYISIYKSFHPYEKAHRLYEGLARCYAESEGKDKIALHVLLRYVFGQIGEVDLNHQGHPNHSRWLGERVSE